MTLCLEVAVAEAPKNNMKSRAFKIGCFLLHSTWDDKPIFFSLNVRAIVNETIKAIFEREESLCIFPGEFGLPLEQESVKSGSLADEFIAIRTHNNKQRELSWHVIKSAKWATEARLDPARQPSFYLQSESDYVSDVAFASIMRRFVKNRRAKNSDLA